MYAKRMAIYLPTAAWYTFDAEFVSSLSDALRTETSAMMDDIFNVETREPFKLFAGKCPGSCHPHHREMFPQTH